jgi:MAC/Perforin domain
MANVIPGGNSLGLGFNLFGEPNIALALRRLFEMGGASSQYTLGTVTYDLPSNANPTDFSESKIQAHVYRNANEFVRDFRSEAKVSGKVNAFKGSASAKYSKLCKGKRDALLVEVSNFSPVYQLTLNDRTASKLAAEVLNDPLYKNLPDKFSEATRETFFAFFRRYGTHYISKVTLGGELSYYCAVDKSYSENTEKIEAQANAEYTAAFKSSASASWSTVDKSWSNSRAVTIETKPAGSLSLKSPAWGDDLSADPGYQDWLLAAKERPTVIEFELEPIAEIFSGTKRDALLHAEEEFSESYIHVETTRKSTSTWPGNITVRGRPLTPQNLEVMKKHQATFVRQAIIDRQTLGVTLDKVYPYSAAQRGTTWNYYASGDMYEDILPYDDSKYILVVTTYLAAPHQGKNLCVASDMIYGRPDLSDHQKRYFDLLRKAGARGELERYLTLTRDKSATTIGQDVTGYLFIGVLGSRSNQCYEKTSPAASSGPTGVADFQNAAIESFDALLEPVDMGGKTLYRLINL